MDYKDIRKLVLSVDDEKLTEQLVEQFLKYMPSKDKMMSLTAYKDKINDLSDAEKFGVIVSYDSCPEDACKWLNFDRRSPSKATAPPPFSL